MKIKEVVWTEKQYSTWWGTIDSDGREITVGSVSYTGNARTPWVSRFSALGFVHVGSHGCVTDAMEDVENTLELLILNLLDQ